MTAKETLDVICLEGPTFQDITVDEIRKFSMGRSALIRFRGVLSLVETVQCCFLKLGHREMSKKCMEPEKSGSGQDVGP